MLNIVIDREHAVVENPDFRVEGVNYPIKWTLDTTRFFGDVYATLKRHFPDLNQNSVVGGCMAAYMIKMLSGKVEENLVKIFGCLEFGTSLIDLELFIGEKDILAPTLKDIEDMRIEYRMEKTFLPVGISDNEGMRFEGLTTVTQVMVGALYYYAYHDYKLVKCKHCGKWFATKTLKKEYCDRESPCYGHIVRGKEPLNCEQAVRNIFQKCGRIKNGIETCARQTISAQLYDNPFLDTFYNQCMPLYNTAKQFPTVENLTNYYNFLKDTKKAKGWLA